VTVVPQRGNTLTHRVPQARQPRGSAIEKNRARSILSITIELQL
jgi:hypothetical protein